MNNYTKKTLNEYISFTESTLKKFSYKNKLGLQSSVADAMDYSLEAGGKARIGSCVLPYVWRRL